MFSSAFKSFSSNITSNYEISKQPTATAGAWTVFDAKKRSSGAEASVFVFKREALDVASNGFGARASATSIRKVQDEVVERLRKEASSLARLRHPSILQLTEPVEDTRSGGLMFATEPVLASLSGALAQKDRTSPRSGRSSRPRIDLEESPSKALQDVELDELEIQKGLLQVAKGLEFLHDSAKLVHGNLNPDAIFINVKSDWKISGLAFAGPPDGAEGHQTIPQIPLSEVLHHDPRIPRFVQLDLDYTSPDFVLDSNINFGADIFSLGLILLACYRNPHASPIETHGNLATYKKICSNTATVPNPSNNYLCDNTLPKELAQTLPKLVARRPAQRVTASEFQQSAYFDNILVNTMRFLDALPAKTSAEKSQFMRGLGRVMPQFPPSVLGKKVLSALLDEMKDRELLALILQNIFKIVSMIPSRKEVVSEKVLPRLREIFLTKAKSDERDTSKEAGLLVVLENIQLIADNCTARQFKDDVLPIVQLAMESTTHSLTDSALQTLPVILPSLDFSTVKHDLFPVVASVFSKTNSLSIKVRGLEALGVLCGAAKSKLAPANDDFSGKTMQDSPNKNVSSLDKFTMQEKVVPLLKAIKTREPAVMMAALTVIRQIGQAADIDFLATEVMPMMWSFALGPLLDLTQFKVFMDVIKLLSAKIEREQIRKLQELSSNRSSEPRGNLMATNASVSGNHGASASNGAEDDFERLVLGTKSDDKKDIFAGALSDGQKLTPNPPSFSWSSGNTVPNNMSSQRTMSPPISLQRQLQPASRSITPDVALSAFPTLQATTGSSASTWTSQPGGFNQQQPLSSTNNPSNFTVPVMPSNPNTWQSKPSPAPQRTPSSSFVPTIAPPPSQKPQSHNFQQPNYNPGNNLDVFNSPMGFLQPQSAVQTPQAPTQKSGLDKYQSLL